MNLLLPFVSKPTGGSCVYERMWSAITCPLKNQYKTVRVRTDLTTVYKTKEKSNRTCLRCIGVVNLRFRPATVYYAKAADGKTNDDQFQEFCCEP